MPRTAPPPKIPNEDKRSREHLFPQEVTAMITAAKKVGRHPERKPGQSRTDFATVRV